MRNLTQTALVAAFFLSTLASAAPGLMLSDRAAAPEGGILIAGKTEAAAAAPKDGILIVGASLVRDGLLMSD
jgi:hypothetical protein